MTATPKVGPADVVGSAVKAATIRGAGRVVVGLFVIGVGTGFQAWGQEPSWVVVAGLFFLVGPEIIVAAVQAKGMLVGGRRVE